MVKSAILSVNVAALPEGESDGSMNNRPTAVSITMEHLCRLATEGVLKVGGCLPTERRIASELGVSRQAVREAINRLATLGILERNHRSRTTIRAELAFIEWFRGVHGTESQSVEAHRVIAPYVSSLASERASVDDTNALARIVRGMYLALDDIEAFRLFDMEFHRVLAHACGNPVLSFVMAGTSCRLPDSSGSSNLQARRGLADIHRRLYRAVRSGNAVKASALTEGFVGLVSARLSNGQARDIEMDSIAVRPFGIEETRDKERIERADIGQIATGWRWERAGPHTGIR